MKKISVYICLILLALLVTSCSEFVTPVAYTRYETTGTQYAVYTANAVGDHILVYKNEAELEQWLPSADITFSFNECHGVDDSLGDGKKYTTVDVRHGAYLTVHITKESGLYGENKRIRLNGQIIIPDNTKELDAIWALTFENFPLVRTNPHGRINPEAVNVIEYK